MIGCVNFIPLQKKEVVEVYFFETYSIIIQWNKTGHALKRKNTKLSLMYLSALVLRYV